MAKLIGILFFIILILFVISSVGIGLWLQTYKALTAEKLVAYVVTEELKKDDTEAPYFQITYTPVETTSALTKVFVKDSDPQDKELLDKRQELYLYGDRFMIESEVINFQDWANILGFKTIYKISRIRGEYTDIEQEQNGKRSVIDLDGGIDPVWQSLEYNQEQFSSIVESVYGSSASQGVRRNSVKWGIYMTEDGLIIRKVD
jgi:hypothetical protein